VTFQSAIGIQVWHQLANFEAVKLSPKKSYNIRTPKNIFLKNSEKIKITQADSPVVGSKFFIAKNFQIQVTRSHICRPEAG
jgi:hypothetical protein